MYEDDDDVDVGDDDESMVDLAGMLCTQVLMAEGRDSKATSTFSRFLSKKQNKKRNFPIGSPLNFNDKE